MFYKKEQTQQNCCQIVPGKLISPHFAFPTGLASQPRALGTDEYSTHSLLAAQTRSTVTSVTPLSHDEAGLTWDDGVAQGWVQTLLATASFFFPRRTSTYSPCSQSA